MRVLVIATERAEKLKKPLISAGCDVSVISPETEESFQKRYTVFLRSIWKEVSTGEYDIIVTRGAGLIGTTAILIGRAHQIPVVPRIAGDKFVAYWEGLFYTVSNVEIRSTSHIIIRSIMFLFCMVAATGIILVSDHLRNRYEVFSKWANQTFIVVPVSIDESRDVKKNRDHSDGQTLLTVTNLNFKGKYEGVKKSLTAVFKTLDERSDVEYVIAGDGRYHEELEAYVDANSPNENVRKRIHLPGYVNPIAPLYRQADVFVYFSYQDGYPNVILEAMSYQLPIVANNAVGMSEQITHEETGIFVNPDDPSNVQAQIASLLNDPEKRQRLGSRAQAHVKRANSHEAVGKQYVRELRSIINQR